MQPYIKHTSIAALMDRSNVDTDQIIPKNFMKKVERTGFGINLFHNWRYLADNITPNPEFELNKPAFKGAKILVAGENFGCGSSREHAPWAIADYGFNTVVSTSFADIFYSNCFKNSILPIIVTDQQLAALMAEIAGNEGVEFTVDLENQKVTTPVVFQSHLKWMLSVKSHYLMVLMILLGHLSMNSKFLPMKRHRKNAYRGYGLALNQA